MSNEENSEVNNEKTIVDILNNDVIDYLIDSGSVYNFNKKKSEPKQLKPKTVFISQNTLALQKDLFNNFNTPNKQIIPSQDLKFKK